MRRCVIRRPRVRGGNAKTKTRHEVSGSGKKLWRQKGTGRARMGSIRSPLWRHGGTTHGPQPRDYSYKLPRKMLLGALRSALSAKLRDGEIKVVQEFAHFRSQDQDRARGSGCRWTRPRPCCWWTTARIANLALGSRNLAGRHAGVDARGCQRIRSAAPCRPAAVGERGQETCRRRWRNDHLRSNQAADRHRKGRRQEGRRADALL